MAALPVLTPASLPAPGSGSPLALAVGLLALIAGGALLLCGLLLPISPAHTSEVPRSAVNRAANMRFDGGRDVPKVTTAPSLRFTAMTQTDIDDHFRLATTL